FNQEMVVLSDGCPGLLGFWLSFNQGSEKSALDVARGGRAERGGFGDRKLLLGWVGDAPLAGAAVIEIVLIRQGVPKLLLSAQGLVRPRFSHLPMTVPYTGCVLAVLLPDQLVDVIHRKAVG